MKIKLPFLLIILWMMTFNLSAQEIKKFLGEYEIKADCILIRDDETFPEGGYENYKIKVEESPDEDANIQFFLGKHGVNGNVKATILNQQEFKILEDQHIVGTGFRSFYLNGSGNIKTDSIFMQYRIVDESNVVQQCDCIGKKLGSSGISSLGANKYKVYIDEKKQVIVLDETLQNQSLTFELINLQGNTIWKKTNTGESISIANLPSGIYLCRILQNGQVIYSDKIIKK